MRAKKLSITTEDTEEKEETIIKNCLCDLCVLCVLCDNLLQCCVFY